MSGTVHGAYGRFIPVYTRYPIVFERGEGMYLCDTQGRRYLDFGSGIGVCALGYGDPNFTRILQEQTEKLLHTSNLFYNVPSAEAAEAFCSAAETDQVFFTNSGAEAIEGAVKIARKAHWLRHGRGTGEIIAMNRSFHGRTLGALSVTGKAAYREPFAPLLPGVRFAEFNDAESVRRLITPDTCAVILETVQGEGGVHPADPEFLAAVRSLCDRSGILMICDEIQCGMGRSGAMFAYQRYGIRPDITVAAKALGCGIPVGAVATRGPATGILAPGDHGSTYGSNPLAMAAVAAVFRLYREYGIPERVRPLGDSLDRALADLAGRKSVIREIRGPGLMKGIELSCPAAPVIRALQDADILVIPSGTHVIRLLPPLILEEAHIDCLVRALDAIL